MEQAVQLTSSGSDAYDPAPHGDGAFAPSAHAVPGGHAPHDACPASGWYRPAAQRVHVALRAADALPASHGTGTALPVAHM